MINIYGTIGPSVKNKEILKEMLNKGMNGIRLNLSHESLIDAKEEILILQEAIKETNIDCKLLIDLTGRELRVGNLIKPIEFIKNSTNYLSLESLLIDKNLYKYFEPNKIVLFDDSKIAIKIIDKIDDVLTIDVIREGTLNKRKSIKIENTDIKLNALSNSDIENLKHAKEFNVYAIMVPFVNNKEDLIELKNELKKLDLEYLKIFSKIENSNGVKNIDEIIDYSDTIVIARGDLGNEYPLYILPKIQKHISTKCNEKKKDFMVVTEMLKNMIENPIPSRAEVLDIFNACLDNAKYLMVTNETAIGKYPIDVIDYLSKTSLTAIEYKKEMNL